MGWRRMQCNECNLSGHMRQGQLSTSGTSAEAAAFLKKSQLTILDQDTSYHSSQSRINPSAISNSTYLDMKNGYFSVPIC